MTLIPWLVAIYVAICAAVYFGNRLLMYFPMERVLRRPRLVSITSRKSRSQPPTALCWLPGTRRRGMTSRPSFTFMATRQTPPITPRIEVIQEHGFGVLYLNNRGYGGSGGRPTEEDNVADAIAAYDHLIGLGVPATRIAAYGELLGSGQAVRLAAARPLAGIVLEAPLTSTIDVARRTYFWLPIRLLITDKYDNERNIRSVTAPVLILHGEQDGVIPVEMGRRAFRAANEPKRIELFAQGTHDDLFVPRRLGEDAGLCRGVQR